MRHLVMLAPANHGSALAALGKQKVERIKAWFSGVEPGQRILDWLSLGSQEQIDLATAYLDYKPIASNFYPFVLTGQTIDKKMYDFLNSYLVEKGSDGVVRVAGANINYSMVKLVETDEVKEVTHGLETIDIHMLKVDGNLRRPATAALGEIPGASHSGKKKGIMASVLSPASKTKAQLVEIFKCLHVDTPEEYREREKALQELTRQTQTGKHRYAMVVFVVKDDPGDAVKDYNLFLLAGKNYTPDKLSKGFFVDRQQNAAHPNHLVYYIDYDVISRNQLTGFRVIAPPAEGLSFYHCIEYRSDSMDINNVLKPNETLYIEIQLKRCVDNNVFRFDNAEDPNCSKKGCS